MKTEITYKNGAIAVQTIRSSAQEKNADVVVSEGGETTYKSIVEIRTEGEKVIVVVFWSHFSEDAALCFYWSDEDKILFVGAGAVSAVINIVSREIIEINYPELFWGWECIGGYVLELCELDCRLYTSSGKLVGETVVDPPYEYVLTDRAIEFSSIVAGKTRIEFKQG